MDTMNNDQQKQHIINDEPGKGYAFSGKIMLTAIVVFFAVVLLMLTLHLYARWYVLRARRSQQTDRRRRRRGGAATRSQVLTVLAAVSDKGLEIEVLNSLPAFLYTSAEAEAECAVCLSEFEEKEIVRLLPKCNHSFHIECIDMWFYSHSTCPLCRSAVERVVRPAEAPCSSSADDTGFNPPMRKCFEVRIDVPPRAAVAESPSSQSSPGSRLLALRRMLSMGRKSPAATRCELEGIGESSQLGSASGETAT